MKQQVYFGIAWRIIALFSIAILSTFLPDFIRGFLGDVPFKPYYVENMFTNKVLIGDGSIDIKWTWGVRHYWFFTLMIFLFILSCINVIISSISLIKYYYPELKSK